MPPSPGLDKTSADDHLTLLLSVGVDTIGNVPYRTRRQRHRSASNPAVDNPEVADLQRLAVSLGETIDDPIALFGSAAEGTAQRLTTMIPPNLRLRDSAGPPRDRRE